MLDATEAVDTAAHAGLIRVNVREDRGSHRVGLEESSDRLEVVVLRDRT